MKNKKSLLTVSGHIFDITGVVQTVTANVNDEVKYSGCGIIVYRPNHTHGDAVIFLKYVSEEYIFGEWVNTYGVSKWKSDDYKDFDMKPMEHKKSLPSKAVKYLTKEFSL